ncbi:oxidoreductase CipA [Penicillium lividum]|nr:oxidoreductase CipA [Penicillium lividum]
MELLDSLTTALTDQEAVDTSNPLGFKSPVFADNVTAVTRLQELALQDRIFTYTPVATGPFLDRG